MTPIPLPIVPSHVTTQEFRTPKTVQRGIVASVVGNMIEWYDFALFGFFAPQIGAHFFPSHDPRRRAPWSTWHCHPRPCWRGGGASPPHWVSSWRVRCTVLSVGYNVGMALLGGTTPMVATWLLSRTGYNLAPAIYLAATAALAFVGATLLPPAARHGITREFAAVRTASR